MIFKASKQGPPPTFCWNRYPFLFKFPRCIVSLDFSSLEGHSAFLTSVGHAFRKTIDQTCWCSVGNVGMNPGVPLKETTSWTVYMRSSPQSLPIAPARKPSTSSIFGRQGIREILSRPGVRLLLCRGLLRLHDRCPLLGRIFGHPAVAHGGRNPWHGRVLRRGEETMKGGRPPFVWLGPPARRPFSPPFFGEGSPTKIDYRKRYPDSNLSTGGPSWYSKGAIWGTI